jgi:hypothetical protein
VVRGGGHGPIGPVRWPIGPLPGRLATIFGAGWSNRVLIPKNPKMAHCGLKLIFMGKQRKSISYLGVKE